MTNILMRFRTVALDLHTSGKLLIVSRATFRLFSHQEFTLSQIDHVLSMYYLLRIYIIAADFSDVYYNFFLLSPATLIDTEGIYPSCCILNFHLNPCP